MGIDKSSASVRKDGKELPPTLLGVPMKWVSLVSLTFQTSAQVFLIKWARGAGSGNEVAYLPSTVVFFTELLKMLVSFCLETGSLGGPVLAARSVHHHMTMSFGELLKVSVPSLLYTVQNNLMFVSLNNLSAAVQQVTYQLKIVTTAVLSVVILGKALGPTKWLALMLLLVGVMLVQWPKDWGTNGSSYHAPGNPTIGFVAVLTACATSGLASVYLEKILKQTSASIWVRNVQLGFFGAVMALFGSLSTDGAKIMEGGFTQGYDFRVLCVIAMNACGGLLCAAVLKYADNILRCFSVALSIILTCVLSSAVLRDFAPDLFFITGAALAIASTFIYSLSPPPARPKAT